MADTHTLIDERGAIKAMLRDEREVWALTAQHENRLVALLDATFECDDEAHAAIQAECDEIFRQRVALRTRREEAARRWDEINAILRERADA